MASLSETTPSIQEEPSEPRQHSRNPSGIRPLSWVESIHDDRPTYISQQLPVRDRPRLEPREATVRNNDALMDLAKFLKENPVPPEQPKPVNLGQAPGEPQTDHNAFVKRMFRVASKRSSKSKTSLKQYRSSDSHYFNSNSVKSFDRPHSRPSEISHHSTKTATTISSSMSFESATSSIQPQLPPQQTPAEEKDIESYLQELDVALKKKPKPEPLKNLAAAQNDQFLQTTAEMELHNYIPQGGDDTRPGSASKREEMSPSPGNTSTPRSFTFKDRRSSHLTGPPSPAPQMPLPPVPTSAVIKQSKSMDVIDQASDGSISEDASEMERNESMISKASLSSTTRKPKNASSRLSEPSFPTNGDKMVSKGRNSVVSARPQLKNGREQRTRARKLKHLHANSTNKGTEQTAVTPGDLTQVSEATEDEGGDKQEIHKSIVDSDEKQANSLPDQISDSTKNISASQEEPISTTVSTEPQDLEQPIQGNELLSRASGTSASQNETLVDSDTYQEKPVSASPEKRRKKRNSETSSQPLHDRIAFLERENKLLEAALMAVLKTGGTLIKCPCGGVGFERAVSSATATTTTTTGPDTRVNEAPRSVPKEMQIATEKTVKSAISVVETPPVSAGLSTRFPREGSMVGRNSEDRRWSFTSDDSMNWNICRSGRDSAARSSLSSALALYTQTRAGLLVGDGGHKAHST